MRGISPAERKIFSRYLLGNLLTGNKARAEKRFMFFGRMQILPEKVPLLIEATVFSKIKKINVICVEN